MKIVLHLKTDDEVLALRGRVEALEAALEDMTAQRNRIEYMYRSETLINTELLDLCREHGVQYRAALKQRPWGAADGGGKTPSTSGGGG